MIALEVLESRYWVRVIFFLMSKRGTAMAKSHRWPCPLRLTVRAVAASHRFGTTVCRLPCTEETGSSRSSVRQIFLPGHQTGSFEVFSLGSEGGQ